GLRPRLPGAARGAGIGATIGAGAVVAAALALVLGVLLVTFVTRLPFANGLGLWNPADPAALQPDVVAIQAALVLVGGTALAAVAWTLLGVIRSRAVVIQA